MLNTVININTAYSILQIMFFKKEKENSINTEFTFQNGGIFILLQYYCLCPGGNGNARTLKGYIIIVSEAKAIIHLPDPL